MVEYDINEMYGQQWELVPESYIYKKDKQWEELVELYKQGIITDEMIMGIMNMRKDPPLVMVPKVPLEEDVPIESRFEILDL